MPTILFASRLTGFVVVELDEKKPHNRWVLTTSRPRSNDKCQLVCVSVCVYVCRTGYHPSGADNEKRMLQCNNNHSWNVDSIFFS